MLVNLNSPEPLETTEIFRSGIVIRAPGNVSFVWASTTRPSREKTSADKFENGSNKNRYRIIDFISKEITNKQKAVRQRTTKTKKERKNYSEGGPLSPVKMRSIKYPAVSLLINRDIPGESFSFSMKLIFVNVLSK